MEEHRKESSEPVESSFSKTKEGKRCPKCKNIVDKGVPECPECHTLLLVEYCGIEERLKQIHKYSLAQVLLKEREYLYEAIYQSEQLPQKIVYCVAYALLFAAIYGLVLGTHAGLAGSLLTAGKIPLILFCTLLVCLPLLFSFNIFLGSKLTLLQMLTTALVATYLTSLVLLSLTPILGLFSFYSQSLGFLHLLNLVFLIIAGVVGICLLWQSLEYFVTKNHGEISGWVVYTWSCIYAFVFFQCAWTMNLFSDLHQLPIFQQLKSEGDFYTALFDLIKQFMGGGE